MSFEDLMRGPPTLVPRTPLLAGLFGHGEAFDDEVLAAATSMGVPSVSRIS
jgi:hypothetical protein